MTKLKEMYNTIKLVKSAKYSTDVLKTVDINKGKGIAVVKSRVELRKKPTFDGGDNIIRILNGGERYYIYDEVDRFYNLGNSYANKDFLISIPHPPKPVQNPNLETTKNM